MLKPINFKQRHACDAYNFFKCPKALYLRCRPYFKSIIIVQRNEINTRLHTESIGCSITFEMNEQMAQVVTPSVPKVPLLRDHSFLRRLNIIFNIVEIRSCFNLECLGFEYPPPSVVQHMPHEQHRGYF